MNVPMPGEGEGLPFEEAKSFQLAGDKTRKIWGTSAFKR